MRRASKILIAIGLALGLAPLAVAFVAERPNDRPEVPSLSAPGPSPQEIDRTEDLRACRDRGAAALEHPPCLRLWSEQRDRFLGVEEPDDRRDRSSARPSIDPPDELHPPPEQD